KGQLRQKHLLEALAERQRLGRGASKEEVASLADDVSKRPDLRTSESTSAPERARAAAEAEERGPHADDMRGNEPEIGSTVPEEIPEGNLFEPVVSEPVTPERAREAYMGSTPDKYSETGRSVVERMRSE